MPHIANQRNSQGVTVTSPKEIVKVFEEYYTHLYAQPESQHSRMLGQQFLDTLYVPKVTQEKLEELSSSISLSEIADIVNKLPALIG